MVRSGGAAARARGGVEGEDEVGVEARDQLRIHPSAAPCIETEAPVFNSSPDDLVVAAVAVPAEELDPCPVADPEDVEAVVAGGEEEERGGVVHASNMIIESEAGRAREGPRVPRLLFATPLRHRHGASQRSRSRRQRATSAPCRRTTSSAIPLLFPPHVAHVSPCAARWARFSAGVGGGMARGWRASGKSKARWSEAMARA
jgi:hypothetical protein